MATKTTWLNVIYNICNVCTTHMSHSLSFGVDGEKLRTRRQRAVREEETHTEACWPL